MAKILLIWRKTLSNQSIKELDMVLNDIFLDHMANGLNTT